MEIFRSSAREFKHIRTMVVCAMLIALNLVIDNFSVSIGTSLRVSFSFVTIAMAGMLFGPVASMACAAISDILAAVLIPRGAYFPGFTVTALVGGLIYGVVLYKKKASIIRALIAKGLVNLFANILLNTLWLSILYGDAFVVIVGARALKNLLALLVEGPLLYAVCILLQTVMRSIKRPLAGT